MLHEIDAQAHRLSALEWQAVAIGRVDNSLRREVEEVRQLLTANVESGRALGPDRAEYDRVDDVLHTFLAAMDEEFGLLQEGRLDEAHAVDDERVDPTFTLLHDLLEDAAVSSAQVAQQAQLTANLGTVSVLGAAVLFTVVLLVAFGRERRATDLAIAERQALARSEERFRALTLNAAELIAILADDGTITYLSPSAAALLGGDPEKRVGHAVGELIGPEDRHRIAELLGRPAPGGARSELRLRRADGTYLDVEAVWTDLRTIPAVNGIVLNARDITERKAVEAALRDSEEHLRQAQKMEAVGVLAGGIAHDFNNLLTVINGYSELILSLLPTDHPQRANLQEIERAGARA
ncbi:MAG: hypothetical protein QOF51_3160, partial [Chloroflexota bacterium]|nr:hypothetical protein [Chloroflexota bacterium]